MSVQWEFVGVRSNLDATQHDLFPVQNDCKAVYSDFVIVQSVLRGRGRDLLGVRAELFPLRAELSSKSRKDFDNFSLFIDLNTH